MTFLELYGEELSKNLSSSDTTNLFTLVRRKLAINQAVEWFVTQTECVQRKVSLSMIDNTSQLNLRTLVTNADQLWIAKRGPEVRLTRTSDSALTVIAGKDLPFTTIEVLNRTVPGWQSELKGTPRCWYLERDGADQFFGVFPPLAVTTGYTAALILPYVVRPVAMTADSDTPFTVASGTADQTLTPWHDAIGFKAASKLELLRKDIPRSRAMDEQAMARVMDYLDKQRAPGGKFIQMAINYRSRSGFQTPRAVRETVTTP